jgi:hypothetical protein
MPWFSELVTEDLGVEGVGEHNVNKVSSLLYIYVNSLQGCCNNLGARAWLYNT